MAKPDKTNLHYDVVLIGAGIMSATLGILLKELQPDLKIAFFERLDRIAAESSDAWNNAGTGHSAFCELNYTPEKKDGSVDCSKAFKIAESFEISKQFWAYLVEKGDFTDNPRDFINKIPHLSLVWGEEDMGFLKKRFDLLTESELFHGMEYSEDRQKLAEWMPLILKKQDPNSKMAATRMDIGTDVNFGELTRLMVSSLQNNYDDVDVFLSCEVDDLKQHSDKIWSIEVENTETFEDFSALAKFVFIGAGGASLTLLDKTDIEEEKDYGGFPVSGQWLVCKNPEIIAKHHAKVYGKAAVGAPPMSVPHLDTRFIDGQKALLFGPFAGFTTKFLKEGSYFDLPFSIDIQNIGAMFGAWMHNLPLTKYLVEQVTQSQEDRMDTLRQFVPDAKNEDWTLATAGQRVQVIKKDDKEGGVLEFGTEVVTSSDKTVAALLGASPGASTAVTVMLDLLNRCFREDMASDEWRDKLTEMIPSYGQSLAKDRFLLKKVRTRTHNLLGMRG